MRRHYAGDISGSFWPGVQACAGADFFGRSGTPSEPSELSYAYNRDDLAEIEAGLETCREQLGLWKDRLDAFFATRVDYTHQQLAERIGVHPKAISSVLEWYARLQLGERIHRCVVETGACQFVAKL